MPSTYFTNFPTISYANNICLNITERATILNKVYNNPNLYYLYDIASGERPDNIANRYYDDDYLAWLLYFSNKITDPYYDWYMDDSTFQEYLTKKYGSVLYAQSKTSFYRNNWYSNSDSISISQYEALDSSLQKFYQPNYGNDYYNTSIINYNRIQEDWSVKTNKIVNYTVSTTSSLILDEIVDVYYNGIKEGFGQVSYSSPIQITIQHTNGVVVDTVAGSCFLIGRESNVSVPFTAVTLISNVIPTIEIPYWSPVSYYDYENELNENNKSIKVMNSRYSGQLVSQLKKLL